MRVSDLSLPQTILVSVVQNPKFFFLFHKVSKKVKKNLQCSGKVVYLHKPYNKGTNFNGHIKLSNIMTQQEFESRTDLTVTADQFDIINRIYMAAGELDKDTFCEDFQQAFLSNAIVKHLVAHCEQLARTVDSYSHAINDQATQLDAARHNMSSMQRTIDGQKDQIKYRDEQILKMQTVLDAVNEHVDLEVETEVAEAYEKQFGKLYVIKMRFEHSWNLSDEEILWLIQHAEE